MKLIKCYVSSFGKIKDCEFEFNDGINTIKEDNGWGKTTLSIFIKAMFYGLEGGTKRSVSENERLKYKPWNSTQTFGGYLQFEWGGKEYKLERFFGNKESEDTINLTDLSTGKVYSGESDWGRRVFEIDEEGFTSTTFFSQKDLQAKSNTSITAKYNSVCEIQDSEAFDKALSKVEEKAKTYKYRGEKGLIPDAKRKLNYLSEEIERICTALDTAKNLKSETDALEKEVEQIKKQADDLAVKVSEAGDMQVVALKKERYDELQAEYKNLSERRLELDKALGGKRPTERELSAYSECAKEVLAVESAQGLLSVQINNLEEEIARQKNQKPDKKTICTWIITALFFIEGITTVWFNLFAGIAGFILFGICLTLLLIGNTSKKNGNRQVLENMLLDRKKQFDEYSEIKQDYVNKLDAFIGGISVAKSGDYSALIDLVKNIVSERKELDDKISKTLDSLEQLKPFIIKYNKEANNGVNVEKLKADFNIAQSEYSRKANELAAKRASILRYEEYAEQLNELESKKAETLENLASYKENFELLNLTAEYLKTADVNLKVKYRAPLQDSLNKYLKMIDGKISAQIDIDLNVTAIEKEGEKSTDYYSKGYQNLFEICKRFALIDVLFAGEKPFIVLDDPFYNLDDEKLQAALELVKKLSKEYQILYFVCHESRKV